MGVPFGVRSNIGVLHRESLLRRPAKDYNELKSSPKSLIMSRRTQAFRNDVTLVLLTRL
jgi:hypothetical protein